MVLKTDRDREKGVQMALQFGVGYNVVKSVV